ncbi:MAG TPA: phosphate ABC transporter substrate-binding protein [Thermoprotei archaeon]|nr:phosphate ABC transporter substrate-binding protein [Thermoprotei archaeon]
MIGVNKSFFLIGCIVSMLVGLVIGAYILEPLMTKPSRETCVIMGSTTVLPIIEECARTFMNRNQWADIRVSGGGSGVGIANLIDGICDIAMASREPNPKEIDAANATGVNMVLHAIALDAISIIVHPSVEEALGEPLKLTLEEVRKIFVGEWTKWSEVNSKLPDKPIIVFIREPGSGTRGTFEEFVLKKGDVCVGNEKHGNPALRDAVKNTPWSIGYVGLGFVEEPNVRVVYIFNDKIGDYVKPSREAVKEGIYPMSRKLYLITNGQPSEGSLVKKFLDFVLSPEGQAIVEGKGFIAIARG